MRQYDGAGKAQEGHIRGFPVHLSNRSLGDHHGLYGCPCHLDGSDSYRRVASGADTHSHPRTHAGNHHPHRHPPHGNGDTRLRTGSRSLAYSGSHPDADAGCSAHTETRADGGVSHGDGDSRAHGYPHSHVDAHTHANSRTHAKADARTHRHTNSGTHAHTEACKSGGNQ